MRSPASLAVLFSEAGSWGIWFPDDATGRATQSGLNIGTVFYNQTWYDAWNRLVEATTDAAMLATFTALRDAVDLGAHSNDFQAAQHMTLIGVTAADFLLHDYYYIRHGHAPTYGIRHMTAYTPGTNITNTERSFAGRLATHNEVQQAVNELDETVTAAATLSGSAVIPLGSADGYIASIALSDDFSMHDRQQLDIEIESVAGGQFIEAEISGRQWNKLPVQVALPTTPAGSVTLRSARNFETGIGGFSHNNWYIWKYEVGTAKRFYLGFARIGNIAGATIRVYGL